MHPSDKILNYNLQLTKMKIKLLFSILQLLEFIFKSGIIQMKLFSNEIMLCNNF